MPKNEDICRRCWFIDLYNLNIKLGMARGRINELMPLFEEPKKTYELLSLVNKIIKAMSFEEFFEKTTLEFRQKLLQGHYETILRINQAGHHKCRILR